jgi:hypothetical protein
VIDGKELSDSGWIFGNGPGPVGGYRTLDAGATFDFSKALPIAKYFSETREYRKLERQVLSKSNSDGQNPDIETLIHGWRKIAITLIDPNL